MRAEPKRHQHIGLNAVITEDGGLWIECEVTAPPSRLGQIVEVDMKPDVVIEVMQRAREAAMIARSTTETVERQAQGGSTSVHS